MTIGGNLDMSLNTSVAPWICVCLTLEADENINPTWSIDAAYGVHGDCKGQSG